MTGTIKRTHRIFTLIFTSYHFFKNVDSLVKILLVVFSITVRSNLMKNSPFVEICQDEETWPHYTLSDKEFSILTRPSEPGLGLTLTKKAMIIVYSDTRQDNYWAGRRRAQTRLHLEKNYIFIKLKVRINAITPNKYFIASL